jgi:hypothetical protein
MPTPSLLPKSNDQHQRGSKRAALASAAAPGSRSKARETEIRHKVEKRAEKLRDIDAQIADGTLVVRQMTTEERGGSYRTHRGS